jgi:hypothetical protein
MTEPEDKCDCPGEVYIIEVKSCSARVNGEEVEGLAIAWVDKNNNAPSHICGRNWAISLATDVLKGRQLASLALSDIHSDDEIGDEDEE